MKTERWHETLFDKQDHVYGNENFTQATMGECDFVKKELKSNKFLTIIDIGCGTARPGTSRYTASYKKCKAFFC